MCGRAVNALTGRDYQELFDLSVEALPPSYNLSPSQTALVVGGREEGYAAQAAVWGFELYGSPLINARAETVGQKPTFAKALREGRVLVPLSGWIEWDAKKKPYRIHRRDGRPVVTAGLWQDGRFVLLTCAPEHPELRALHPRMPVVLPRSAWRDWLETDADPEDLQPLLRAFPGDVFALSPTSTAIGNVRNNYPELLEAPLSPAPYPGSPGRSTA